MIILCYISDDKKNASDDLYIVQIKKLKKFQQKNN